MCLPDALRQPLMMTVVLVLDRVALGLLPTAAPSIGFHPRTGGYTPGVFCYASDDTYL